MADFRLRLYLDADAPALRINIINAEVPGADVEMVISPRCREPIVLSTASGELVFSGVNSVLWAYTLEFAMALPLFQDIPVALFLVKDGRRQPIAGGSLSVRGADEFRGATAEIEVAVIQGPPPWTSRGPWSSGTYPPKSSTTHTGSTWLTEVETDEEPGNGEDWEVLLDGSGAAADRLAAGEFAAVAVEAAGVAVEATATKADKSVEIEAAGLVKGGGTLASSREIRVDAASAAEIAEGATSDKAVTPSALSPVLDGLQQAGEVYTDGAVTDRVLTVSTMAALRAIAPALRYLVRTVRVLGYYAEGDGGGGTFFFAPGSTKTDDNGLVIRPTDLTPLSSGRWQRVREGLLDPRWFGAVADALSVNGALPTGTNSGEALQACFNALKDQDTLLLPNGGLLTDRKLTINLTRYNQVVSQGWIGPYGALDDFLLSVTQPSTGQPAVGDFGTSLQSSPIKLRCFHKCRGVELLRIDCSLMSRFEIERPYGTGVKIRGVRESTLIAPLINFGLRRQKFDPTAVAAWSGVQAYTPGQRVFVNNAPYDAGTTYGTDEFVVGSDGFPYHSIAAGNIGHDPTLTANRPWWVRVEFEFYECVVANTNNDPTQYSLTASVTANRKWKFVHWDECCFDIDEDISATGYTDGTNSLLVVGLDIRNCDHRHLVRIDSNANFNNNRPVPRGITFLGGHIHYIPSNHAAINNPAYGYTQEMQDAGVGVFVGSGENIRFVGVNVVDGNGSRAYNLFRLGTRAQGKAAKVIDIDGLMSVGAPDGIGVHVMPSFSTFQNRNSHINVDAQLAGNGRFLVDPNGLITFDHKTRINAPRFDVRDMDTPDDTAAFASVFAKNGSPNGNLTAPRGSLALRRNAGVATPAHINVDGGATWWPLLLRLSGTSGNRPALSGGNEGAYFYDTSIVTPVVHNGTGWDAVQTCSSETLSAAGALSVNKMVSLLSAASAGTFAVTLAAPAAANLGFRKTLSMINGSGDVTLDLANVVGGSAAASALFQSAGDILVLEAVQTGPSSFRWIVVKERGVVLS